MAALRITPQIEIGEDEIEERFVHASGPGGQNVNKVASAVQLRFNAALSSALPPAVLKRLTKLSGRRMTEDGVLILLAQRFRSQERNRADARARLAELIARAATEPRPRVATKPTAASKQRRLTAKVRRSSVKRWRAIPSTE